MMHLEIAFDWDNKKQTMIMEIYGRWRETQVAIETMQKKRVGVEQGTEREGVRDWRTELAQFFETLTKTY